MPEHELTPVLLERARSAIVRAQSAVAEADLLRALSRLLREPTSMAKRCAWCGRLALGSRWTPADRIPPQIRDQLEVRMTHGICTHWLRCLEREGKTAPIEARAGAPSESVGVGESSTSRGRRR